MIDGSELNTLIQRDPETAWRRLVDDYSGLILGVIGRYNPDQDARMDAYLYVLEELAREDMSRVRRYGHDPARPCQFATWLKLVVRNLYFDWFRHRHGRKSVPKAIQQLSERAQRIFKLIYWDGHRPRNAYELVCANSPPLSYIEFLEELSTVDALLTGVNRAKIQRDYLRGARPVSLDREETQSAIEAQAESEPARPDAETALAEERAALWALLEELSAEDRLLVRLRFYEGLTARQIALALGVADHLGIYRRLDRVCAELERSARAAGLSQILRAADRRALADSGVPDSLRFDQKT